MPQERAERHRADDEAPVPLDPDLLDLLSDSAPANIVQEVCAL